MFTIYYNAAPGTPQGIWRLWCEASLGRPVEIANIHSARGVAVVLYSMRRLQEGDKAISTPEDFVISDEAGNLFHICPPNVDLTGDPTPLPPATRPQVQ